MDHNLVYLCSFDPYSVNWAIYVKSSEQDLGVWARVCLQNEIAIEIKPGRTGVLGTQANPRATNSRLERHSRTSVLKAKAVLGTRSSGSQHEETAISTGDTMSSRRKWAGIQTNCNQTNSNRR